MCFFSATASEVGQTGLGSEYFQETTALPLEHSFKPSASKALSLMLVSEGL